MTEINSERGHSTNENVRERTRTPRIAKSIEAGAMKLPLEERVNLCKKLAASIKEEVAKKQEDLNSAQKLIDGLK